MDIFSIFTLCGGIAFFMYGMSVLSSRLEKLAGGKLEQLLKKMTSNRFKALLLGAGITIAMQSSTAVTVMLVGLVNSGIMELGQTIGVIMGSNIGTTLTAWILSLSGIDSDVIWLQLLKPEVFSPVAALIGIVLRTKYKDGKMRSTGTILVGFAILMYGTVMMRDSMAPLAEMPQFTYILTAFTNPFVGIVVGAVFTALLHSSAASVAILQALSRTGSISYGMALPIIMGQNIGTCLTALLTGVGANRNARRVSIVHISFNLIGTAVFMLVFYGSDLFFHFAFMDAVIQPTHIALMHSIFNIATTVLLLPFTKQLERLAYLVIKEDAEEKPKYTFVDPLLLATPSVAIAECGAKTVEMAKLAESTLLEALRLLENYDDKIAEKVRKNEDKLDLYEDRLGTMLVKISSKSLSQSDSRSISKQLHTIGDFERIGDHALNLLGTAKEIHEKSITFSGSAQKEIDTLLSALKEILRITIQAFSENDLHLASKVEPLEQVIDLLITEIKSNHIDRLQKGDCTIEFGFVLSDLLTNCERVSDHCSNIAVCVMEEREDHAEQRHAFLHDFKAAGEFTESLDRDLKKYQLP